MTQQCCVSMAGAGCVDLGNCQGVTLDCTSAATCADGEVCCAKLNGGIPKAKCSDSCGGGIGPGGGSVQLCDSDAECAPKKCVMVFGGFSICQGGGMMPGMPPDVDAGAGP
jgi:hypothetical protein